MTPLSLKCFNKNMIWNHSLNIFNKNIIQGVLEWLKKSLNLVLILECLIWAVKYGIFSVTLGHLNIMFPKITIFNSKIIRGGRKSTSKNEKYRKISKFKLKKNPTFEHFDLQKTHYKFFLIQSWYISFFGSKDKWG